MDLMTLVAKLVLDDSQFQAGVASATAQGSAATGAFSKWGVAMGSLIAQGITRGIRAAVDFGKAIVETGMSFEASMSAVKAVANLTDQEFEAVTQKARDLGGSTVFTAEQVSEALYYMGLAGWNAQEMLDGVAGVLDLAAASGEDLGTVSDIVTDAITAFGLKAKDVSHFVDVLAAASANSNTTIDKVGTAFRYIAPIAGTLGYSIDDVALALGLVANNGIKGTQAGTSLRQILSSMVKPSNDAQAAMEALGLTLFEDDGKVKSFKQVIEELRQAMQDSGFDRAGNDMEAFYGKLSKLDKELDAGRLSQEEYNAEVEKLTTTSLNQDFLAALTSIGGLRGISTMMALMNSTDEDYTQLETAIAESAGAAHQMAQTMLDNLQGDLTLLKSAAAETALQTYDKVNPLLRFFVQLATEELTRLNNMGRITPVQDLSMDSLRRMLLNDLGDETNYAFNRGYEVFSKSDMEQARQELAFLADFINGVSTEDWAEEFGESVMQAQEELNSIGAELEAITGKTYTVRIQYQMAVPGDEGFIGPIKPEGSHASGLWSVPWDGYIAELHRGERIQTASQARHDNGGGASAGDIAAAVKAAVSEAMANLSITLDKKVVGKVMGDTVSSRVHDNINFANAQTAYSHGR